MTEIRINQGNIYNQEYIIVMVIIVAEDLEYMLNMMLQCCGGNSILVSLYGDQIQPLGHKKYNSAIYF